MRLLVKLLCTESSLYETQYHYHLQSFIYNLLRDSKYNNLHDKEGCKFFCYSNVFPVNNFQEGDNRTLIISSPDRGVIEYFYKALNPTSGEIRIGRMRFRVKSCHPINVKIPEGLSFTLVTGTPIVIRIPRERYKVYGIEPPRNYDYLFWRAEHPIEAFISQIENNLLKKYYEYYGHSSGADVKQQNIPSSLFTIPKTQIQKTNLNENSNEKYRTNRNWYSLGIYFRWLTRYKNDAICPGRWTWGKEFIGFWFHEFAREQIANLNYCRVKKTIFVGIYK